MSIVSTVSVPVEISGKIYHIRCPEADSSSLQQAAEYLTEKMQSVREVGSLASFDRLAVIAALNVTHELMLLEKHFTQRLFNLLHTIDTSMEKNTQLELPLVEQTAI